MSRVELSPKVSQFLQKQKHLLIDGQWRNPIEGGSLTVENPATEQHLDRVGLAGPQDVELAVQAARGSFDKNFKKMNASDRAKNLWRLADLIDSHRVELAQLESLDNGKPYQVALAADVPLAAEIFRYMAGWSTKMTGDTIPLSVPYTPDAQYLAYTLKEPIGVVAQIIPWNFPLLMAAWKLAPALATGCSVILKPAEQTPLSALMLAELALEAGIPAGMLNVLTGDGSTGALLSAHSQVDKVAFTGSTEVGRLIVDAAKGNLKKVSLELGGKSPNIIFKDADLEKAIPAAASAIFFNHGQCCCAGSRLYIEDEVYEEVIDGVKKCAEDIVVGDGLESNVAMGPVVSKEQYDRVCSYIAQGEIEGAQVVTGGKASTEKGYFVNPTLIKGVDEDMKVMQEEIFGPVVCAASFKSEKDVVEKGNNSVYGLAAGIWTKDIAKAHRVSSGLKAGTTWINCYNIFDAALPFGGYKQSGWGREMGKEALDLYTQTKSVCTDISS